MSSWLTSSRGTGSRSRGCGSGGGLDATAAGALRGLAPALAGAAAGIGAACLPAPSAIAPSRAPMATVSPVLTAISDNTPEAGAGTSIVTLSVSSSTKGSSVVTASPACLNHWPTVASTTDSPRAGTRISVAMVFRSFARRRGRPGRRRGVSQADADAGSSSRWRSRPRPGAPYRPAAYVRRRYVQAPRTGSAR